MNTFKKYLIGSAAGAVMLGSATLVFAVGTNGDFEAGTNPGSFLTVNSGDSTTITGWTVDTGNVDYIGTYWQSSPAGGRSVDLDGNVAGSISQTFPTVIGAMYTVTFDLSGNPDTCESIGQPSTPLCSVSNKQMTVNATGGGVPAVYSFDTAAKVNTLSDMKWESHTYSFVATGTSSTLSFASSTSGAFGPALDHVVITDNIPTKPNECTGTYSNIILGTSGSDNLTGTTGDDLIFALGGSDYVDGKGGSDCIVGGDGSDKLIGNNGADVVIGGLGNDDISGDEGADMLVGNEGNDHLSGGDGKDNLSGGDGNDALFGDNNDDTLSGDLGTDLANGGASNNDTCTAEARIACEH